MNQHSLGVVAEQTIDAVEAAAAAQHDSCNRSDAQAYLHRRIPRTRWRLPLYALSIMERGATSHVAHGSHQVKAERYHVEVVVINTFCYPLPQRPIFHRGSRASHDEIMTSSATDVLVLEHPCVWQKASHKSATRAPCRLTRDFGNAKLSFVDFT